MNKVFYKKLGKRIKDLRTERGLTQEILAEKADLHFSYTGEIERAEKKPSVDTLIKLAKALDVHVKDIFDF